MPQRTIAYLDMLGFKSYTLIDPAAAAQLLLNYHQIINTKLADMAHFPANAYTTETLVCGTWPKLANWGASEPSFYSAILSLSFPIDRTYSSSSCPDS